MIRNHVAALLFGLCTFAIAARAAAGDEPAVSLNEIVVTATRTEKDPRDLTQSVTVITAEDIRKSGAMTAAEAIGRTAGVDLNEYGAKGAQNTISIRGASYKQVLVLLDGRRLNAASDGGFNMSNLPVLLEEIGRIEIVRGPSSALYGADAVGGVVNIITKKAAAAETAFSAEAGSHGYQTIAVMNSNRLDKFSYLLSAEKEKSDGFRINSDLDKTIAAARLGYVLTRDSSLEISANYLDKQIGAPGSEKKPKPFARESDRSSGASLAFRTKFSNELDFRGNLYGSRDEIIYDDHDPIFPRNGKHIGRTTGAEAQADWMVNPRSRLTFGVEAREDHLSSTDAGEHTASLLSAYLQDELYAGEPLIIVIGGRSDSHSAYGDRFSPRASARWLFAGSGTIISASAGRAFRAPTFNDLYWLDSSSIGNPNLKPETSTEYEGGIEQPFGKVNSVKLALFERKVKDLIKWQPDAGYVYRPVNIGRARITGYEAEAKVVPIERLAWAVNYTYINPVDEITGQKIYYDTPETQLKSYVSLVLPSKTTIHFEGRVVDNYVKPGEPSWRYTVADAAITQPVSFNRHVKGEVFISEKNIFNRKYSTVKGYPMPPAEIFGGIAVTF